MTGINHSINGPDLGQAGWIADHDVADGTITGAMLADAYDAAGAAATAQTNAESYTDTQIAAIPLPDVESLPTAATDTTLVLSPDGAGGVAFAASGGAVASVNGQTGTVVLAASDVGADASGAAAAAQSAAASDATTKANAAQAAAIAASDTAGAAAAAQAASQPLDSDLTAIAALTTTSFGRGLLTDANAAALRTSAALGTAATQSGTFGTYFAATAASAPVTYWRLGEAAGATTAVDQMGNAAGTYSGTITAMNVPGAVDDSDGSVYFATPVGIGQGIVSIGSSGLNAVVNGDLGSMVAWGRITNPAMWGTSPTGYLIHIRNASADTNYICVGHIGGDGAYTLSYRRSTTSGIVQVAGIAPGFTDDWFCMALTWSVAANQMIAYLNGVQVGTTQTGIVSGTWDFSDNGTNILGAGSAAAQPWLGYVDEPAIWNRVLTAAEIAGLYAAARQRVGTHAAAIEYVIDGGGSAITTGVKGYITVPFNCTIWSNRVMADQTGSIVIDIWKAPGGSFPPTVTNTITASDLPTLSSAKYSEDLALTGWTVTCAAGDVLAFNVNSATTVTRVTLGLTVVRT